MFLYLFATCANSLAKSTATESRLLL